MLKFLLMKRMFFMVFFFQDVQMQQVFAAYPELVCIDATYKLLELRLPL